MEAIGVRRVLIVLLVCVRFNEICGQAYTEPSVTIQALYPQGIRVTLSDDPDITSFSFEANINQKISKRKTIVAHVTSPTNGKWLYEDHRTKLKVGDIINYNLSIVKALYIFLSKLSVSYTVTELVSPSTDSVDDSATSTVAVAECSPTSTVVRNGKACAGQTIFEDNFDSLREDLWQLEQYIPGEPDFPFVSYQRPPIAPTVSVQEGYLYIKPILQQDLPGFSNSSIYTATLDLFSGCTATATKCLTEAWGASILPPIASGRITSRSFAFTYGVVEVRAKLPQGDWLYPDILLESLMKKYGGLNYASGVLRIAGSRGNPQLSTVTNEVGNKLLYGGPMLDMKCRNYLLSRKLSNKAWGEDFHVYTARWEPERITLSVDGEEWTRIEPAASGLQSRFPRTCDLPRSFLSRGSNLAPFDDHFFLTLGLAAGGITEFSDDLTSAGRPKPWQNSSRKASLRFWEDLVSWHRTWIEPALVVDYVRVRAL